MADFDPDVIDPQWRELMVVGDDELQALSGYDVVMGHFSLPNLRRITAPSSIATVVREPRTRLLSNYAYWRFASGQALWRGWSLADYALRLGLDDFLAGPVIASQIDNLVCRMLIGSDDRIPEDGFIAPADVPDVASRAIEALRSLGFVDSLELGDRVWRGLSAFFGVRLAPAQINTAADWGATAMARGAHVEITRHTLDLLEARTAADAIVYRHVMADAGYGTDAAAWIADATFANELFRLGNVLGRSADELRERFTEIAELKQRLDAQELELRRTEEELRNHRASLDGIQGSASWRLTAPARAAKRRLKSAQTLLRRPKPG